MSDLPSSVHIMEVGPRDGLQIEPVLLPTDRKVRLVHALVDAGVSEIEIASFVSARKVPQMADAEAVVAAVMRRPGVQYRGLWLNQRGLLRAVDAGLDIEAMLTFTASETFALRNTGRGLRATFEDMPAWIAHYRAAGVGRGTIGVMAAFGCNFEGPVDTRTVLASIREMAGLMRGQAYPLERITLADTMGWATPASVRRLVGAIRNEWPEAHVRLHLHDTRGCALANALAAMELGVREFDASVGGLGGCPFAGHTGAAGNLCTEDLVFACEEMGIATGIDIDPLVEIAREVQGWVGHELPGKVMKGGTLSRWRARC